MSKALIDSLSLLKQIKAQLATESDATISVQNRTHGSIKRSNINNQLQTKKFEEDISSLMLKIDNIFQEAHQRQSISKGDWNYRS